MLLFQGFMFYTLKIKEYNMGMFVETATFVGTFFMIASNFFVQKTLRSFMIINLQIENQFKEQTEIFENLTDGAIIFRYEE
jgi:hypothetical protein